MEGERIAKSMTIYVEKYRAQLQRVDPKSGGDPKQQQQQQQQQLGVDEGGDAEERKKSVELVKKVRRKTAISPYI